jgi:hypothetical protein
MQMQAAIPALPVRNVVSIQMAISARRIGVRVSSASLTLTTT